MSLIAYAHDTLVADYCVLRGPDVSEQIVGTAHKCFVEKHKRFAFAVCGMEVQDHEVNTLSDVLLKKAYQFHYGDAHSGNLSETESQLLVSANRSYIVLMKEHGFFINNECIFSLIPSQILAYGTGQNAFFAAITCGMNVDQAMEFAARKCPTISAQYAHVHRSQLKSLR